MLVAGTEGKSLLNSLSLGSQLSVVAQLWQVTRELRLAILSQW